MPGSGFRDNLTYNFEVSKMYRLILLLPLLLTLGTGCAVNPVTGKSELSFISEASEIAIGQEQYLPSQQSQGGLYRVDRELTRYVNEVGQRVAAVSDRQLPYEFVVLNNSVPNAWALPGGKIAVNRGLLLKLSSEAELAAVLGHEIVHAAARHGAKSMERGAILQGAILATAIGVSDSDYSNYIVGGAQLGAQLMTHRYGRSAELESDYYGIQYMVKAGYDPRAAISLQETFVKLSEGRESSWLEGLFASHPPSRERVDKNRETVAALAPRLTGDLETGKNRYQQKLAYLKRKNDSYNAFDKANTLASSARLDSALKSLNSAIKGEPGEARFYGLKGDIYLEKKQYREANIYYDKALGLDADYYEYYLGRGLSLSKLGRSRAARQDLKKSNDLLPTAIAMNELGELSLFDGDTKTAKNYFQYAMGAGGETGQTAINQFTKLDLPDNPGKYLAVKPFMDHGRLVAIVGNRTQLNISSFDVTYLVTVNGQTLQRTITSGPIRAGQQLRVNSGFTFRDEDNLEYIRATISRANI